jgi:hypothetical protein
MAKAFDPKAKAKRQQVVAAVGALILVALLVWRVPQVIALMNKKPAAETTPVTAPAPAPVTPTPGAQSSPKLPPTSASDSVDLADSDSAPVAGPGQLASFSRFVSKDPFLPQTGERCVDSNGVVIACQLPSGSTSKEPRQPAKKPKPETSDPVVAPTPKPAAREGAQISVNGSTESVAVNGSFPSADPVFRLISVSSTSARVAIDGGSYTSGVATITLRRGDPVTLVNTADGTRYRVALLGA